MKTIPLNDLLAENSLGVGIASRKMMRERAVELAVISGHSPQDVSKSNWEQAKQELRGNAETAPRAAAAVPEAGYRDSVPGIGTPDAKINKQG